MMRKIIVHGGPAHLDDYMAASLAWAHAIWKGDLSGFDDDTFKGVERRDPTPEELADAETWVLDVGGVIDPELHNFDHHQLPRGSKDCAMTLLADFLGVRSIIGKLFPWFEVRGELDACGPFATAKGMGLEWANVSKFMGPFEDLVLDEFRQDPKRVVRSLAQKVLRALVAYDRVGPLVKSGLTGQGIYVVDFTAADPGDVRLVEAAFTKDNGVSIFHDDRGNGLTLLRMCDDPMIDFSRCEGDKDVMFAHKGGFICKTASKDIEAAMRLIAKAVKA